MISSSGERRPATSECLELHVLYVPDEQWNSKLNKVSVDAIDSFVSAGFIRVYPDICLKTLREELGALLGADRDIGKYSFLKCVGQNLALVKAKQERELKVKSFAPPYAPQPELYLLSSVENDSSICSHSLTPDMLSYSTDPQTYYPPKTLFGPGMTKERIKFPQIKQASQLPPPTRSPDDEESYSSPEEKDEEQSVLKQTEMLSLKDSPAKIKSIARKKRNFKRNCTRDSGVPESLEDQDSGFSLTQDRKSKDSQTLQFIRKKSNDEVHENTLPTPTSAPYNSPPAAPPLALSTRKPASPAFPTNREELVEEIKSAKEERKRLERTRQELLRKGKELLALNKHRRNQARDSWKRRYFDTKKATAPLEETLRSLRQEKETFYNKLLQQLQARDGRNKHKRLGKASSTKNELIIQIMTESCEMDNLRRNVDDAKMKLATELKLRKQASTELRALKAELTQKKTQSLLSGLIVGSMDFGPGSSRSQSKPV